jgi:uncharacterized protein DUF5677
LKKIIIPNTDAIFDPAFASEEARRVFGDYLDAAADLREYGKDLLKRLMASSVDNLPDLVVVAGLLRQLVVSLDGWQLCATGGAAQAARVHLRGVLEAFLYMEWILTRGKERWARQLYIATIRANRRSTRRAIPGTEEHRLFSEAWEQSFEQPHTFSAETIAQARLQDRGAQDLMESRVYEHIYRDFEAFVAKRGREPEWFEIGHGAVNSIYGLASELGRRAEYFVLYESYSEAAHGDRTNLHFRKESEGNLSLEPVRAVAALASDVSLAIGLPMRAYLLLLQHYRPDERPVFARTYVERWRKQMGSPNVTVNTERVPLYG